jgi:pyruvate dehydrogenase E1 component alpha subunit
LKEWQAKDPVDKGRDYLLAQGVGQPALDAMRAEIAAEIERSIDEAEAAPDPRAEDLLEHVYAKEGIPGGTRA